MSEVREILFRGERNPKYGAGWCYGVPYTDCDGDCIMTTHNSREVVIEDTVGQFTGLYDSTKWESLSKSEQEEWLKNHTSDEWRGRKIFEGDIISMEDEFLRDTCGIVRFGKYGDKGTHVGFYVDWSGSKDIFLRNDIGFWTRYGEVIGNMHDSPELLKE